MKLINIFYAFTGGLLMASCSTKVYVQKDDSVNLNDYKTYMWVDTRANENDNEARTAAFADISMRNSVNAELRNLGWVETESNPDALVGYDILVERGSEQRSDPVYTQSFTRTYYNPYTKRWSTIYYPSQFVGYQNYQVPVKEGTITVSIMDSKSDKLIWQGWTTESMNYTRFSEDEISRSVKNIFNKFDVATR